MIHYHGTPAGLTASDVKNSGGSWQLLRNSKQLSAQVCAALAWEILSDD